MFPHHNIKKCTLSSQDWKTQNYIHHVMVKRFQLSNSFAAKFDVNVNLDRTWGIMSYCSINHNLTKNAQIYQMKGMICRA
jgi:hypothetical protein